MYHRVYWFELSHSTAFWMANMGHSNGYMFYISSYSLCINTSSHENSSLETSIRSPSPSWTNWSRNKYEFKCLIQSFTDKWATERRNNHQSKRCCAKSKWWLRRRSILCRWKATDFYRRTNKSAFNVKRNFMTSFFYHSTGVVSCMDEIFSFYRCVLRYSLHVYVSYLV